MLVRSVRKSLVLNFATHPSPCFAILSNNKISPVSGKFIRHESTPSTNSESESSKPQRNIWDDLNNLEDFYDPNTDWGHPEEEDHMTESDYRSLIRRLRPSARSSQQVFGDQKKNEFSIDKNSLLHHIKLGLVTLPENFVTRILTLLKDCPRSWLHRDAKNLRNLLRLRTYEKVTGVKMRRIARSMLNEPSDMDLCTVKNDSSVLSYNKQQVLAYVFAYVPNVYAANYRVFSEISRININFKPRKLLDFGSGCGTAVWAASQVWESLAKYTLVEPSESMNLVSKRLLHGFQTQSRLFLHDGCGEKFPLVVASYSFSELSNDESRRTHLISLWNQLEPDGILSIVEHGTPVGYKIIRQIRSFLLDMMVDEKPKILAPCVHEYKCPLGPTTWCHFVQRVRMPPSLGVNRHSKTDWQNGKFSYLIVQKCFRNASVCSNDVQCRNKLDSQCSSSRLIRQPIKRGKHVIMDLCNPNGLADRKIVSKKHGKDAYTDARKSAWGDLFDLQKLPAQQDDRKLRNWKNRHGKSKVDSSSKNVHNILIDQIAQSSSQ